MFNLPRDGSRVNVIRELDLGRKRTALLWPSVLSSLNASVQIMQAFKFNVVVQSIHD